MNIYCRSFIFILSFFLLTSPVYAYKSQVLGQSSGWGWQVASSVLAAVSVSKLMSDIPIRGESIDIAPEFTHKSLITPPELDELLKQSPDKEPLTYIHSMVINLLGSWFFSDSEGKDSISAGHETALLQAIEKQKQEREESTLEEQLSFHNVIEDDSPCRISINMGDSPPPIEGQGNTPIEWLVSQAKAQRVNIGHELSACFANIGGDSSDGQIVADHLIAGLSSLSSESSQSSEPSDGSITTPASIQSSASSLTSGASDTTIIIMDLNDDALPKGLNSGRYALTKTNEPGLVMAFHSEVKSCGIDQFPPDQQKLITPKIDFCDKQASVEVKVMQQDGSIMLASMKPLFQAVVTDSPSYSHKHTAHEQPLSKPDESIAFEDKAIGKSLKSAMSSSTWYLIDVNRNKMYPLLNQKLKQDNTHFTVSLDSELLDDWAMELNEREKELKVAKLTQRVSQLEESAKQGEAEQLILDQSLAKNQKFVNALMQDVKSLKLQMAEFMSNTSPWSSPFQAQQIGYLESSLLELQNDAFELGRLVEILQATSYNGQFTWKIPEVIRRRQEAVNGRTLSLYSAPFYSSRFGYKMCLRVYLNGDGSGKNTHISLFFTIMRGEYDDLLPWPFNQRVTLRLVDSTGQRRHITERFMPDTTSSSFQKPKKYPSADMNRASGMPKFVRIDEVFGINGHFINDNNIYFKAIIDLTNLPDLTD